MLLCRREVAVARKEIDVDEVKGCEVWEGEASVVHKLCRFLPFCRDGYWEEGGKATIRVVTRTIGIDG